MGTYRDPNVRGEPAADAAPIAAAAGEGGGGLERTLLEAIPAFVLALDQEGRIVFWNRQLERATGRRREQMLGQPGEALIGAGGVRPLPVNGGGERLVRWQRATAAGPDGVTGAWTYAIGCDVTDEDERVRQHLRAERLAAVGTLTSGLAHEVRNPLNAATLQLEVLRRRIARLPGGPEATHDALAIVEQEVQRLESLVSDCLAFAQPRPLRVRQVALAGLCQEVLTALEPKASAAGVRFAFEPADSLPAVQVDPDRLRQALHHLVRNGLESMHDGGVLRIELGSSGDGRHVEIHVVDDGPGFPETAPVFDAFFTTKPTGTGLGLSIVHRIVTDHGGTIRVRSKPGDTRFTIALPAGTR